MYISVFRDQHKENMYRFIQKGAEYEPYRVRSAIQRPKSGHKLPHRPQTVANMNVTDNGVDGRHTIKFNNDTSCIINNCIKIRHFESNLSHRDGSYQWDN